MKGFSHYIFWRRFSGFAALRVRRGIFDLFMKRMEPNERVTVLDVGVTGDLVNKAENFFEQWYPWPSQVTALGIEDASYLERMYPGLTFVRADAQHIPFADKSFDIVFSSATLEHVGSRTNQRQCINEMLRVGKRIFITTPDRYFPLEVHTGIPLLHYLPVNIYRRALRFLGLDYFAQEENLNLLSRSELAGLFPHNSIVIIRRASSLVAYVPRL